MDDGSFLIAWDVQSPDLTQTVFMARLDTKTMTVDKPVVLAEGVLLGDWLVSASGSGRGVFVWQTLFPDSAPNGAFLRTICVRP
jgi:hypothetical protein